MSGPKYSAAELERMRQEQLERERLEALKRLKEAQENYRRAQDKAAKLKKSAEQMADGLPGYCSASVKSSARRILSGLTAEDLSGSSDPGELNLAAQRLAERKEAVSHELDALFGTISARMNTLREMNRSGVKKSFVDMAAEQSGQAIRPGFLDFSGRCEADSLAEKVRQLRDYFGRNAQLTQHPEERRFDEACAAKLQQILDGNLTAADGDRIRALQQAMYNEEAELRRRIKEFSDRYADYVAVAAVLHMAPKPPSGFQSLDALQKELDELMALYRKKDEMDYIADQINEVMIDLGYGFVTSKVLMRKDHSEADCSLYQADERTGIAVYTDQSGTVMMRMAVLGEDGDITDEDRDFSYQRQIDFCAGHKDIVDALAERGIFFKQISYAAPDRKHTYKHTMQSGSISTGNTGTVSRGADNNDIVLQRIKINRRRRRRGTGKAMHAV